MAAQRLFLILSRQSTSLLSPSLSPTLMGLEVEWKSRYENMSKGSKIQGYRLLDRTFASLTLSSNRRTFSYHWAIRKGKVNRYLSIKRKRRERSTGRYQRLDLFIKVIRLLCLTLQTLPKNRSNDNRFLGGCYIILFLLH